MINYYCDDGNRSHAVDLSSIRYFQSLVGQLDPLYNMSSCRMIRIGRFLLGLALGGIRRIACAVCTLNSLVGLALSVSAGLGLQKKQLFMFLS